MYQDLRIGVRYSWNLVFALPAALGQLWGWPWWVTLAGVMSLLLGAFFGVLSAYYRGNTDGMKWSRELYRA